MKTIINLFIKRLFPVVLGIFIGGLVNYLIIMLTNSYMPDGVDTSDIESIKNNIHRYTPFHFMFPFLAHALGTFSAAFFTLKTSKSIPSISAYLIGSIFLIGGTIMVFQLPSPLWFNILDLGFAYMPMAWLAIKLSR